MDGFSLPEVSFSLAEAQILRLQPLCWLEDMVDGRTLAKEMPLELLSLKNRIRAG